MTLFDVLADLVVAEAPVVRVAVIAPVEHAGTFALVEEDGTVHGALDSRDQRDEVVRQALRSLRAERSDTHTITVGETSWELFFEVFPSPPRLIIVGASNAAQPLTRIAKIMGFRTVVVDARAAFAGPERFPEADRVIKGWPQDVLPDLRLDGNSYVVLLSHDAKFDQPTLECVLPSRVRYIGAIGSRKTQMARLERLRGQGYSDDQLSRLHGPIGLDLGGRSAEETALAIMAEVVSVRRGGTGRPLRERLCEASR